MHLIVYELIIKCMYVIMGISFHFNLIKVAFYINRKIINLFML